MTAWQTTVDRLLLVFRDALRALVPHVERVRIEWRDGAAYDDWDEIAQTLYEKIVVASLRWSMPEEEREHCELPEYNTSYATYAGKTVIIVSGSRDERLVFHSFATETDPFDKVRACKVDRGGRALEGDFVLLDADTAAYSAETPATTLVELTVDV